MAGLLGGVVGMIPLWFAGPAYLLPLGIVWGVVLGVLMRWIPSCTGKSLLAGFVFGLACGALYQLATIHAVDSVGLQLFGFYGLVAMVVARFYVRRVW
ncbi:hypothetical protein CAQU_01820 [Corynebacterium aquilae DSM 44791]|uniref:Uncharacterized protein n=1 Tax=Corynebacterium aquilae DSM 44791 TaxID=1431546 RepID=A0A1L7CDW9_9CORY|nr:hypothetical protein CAQU_01820 [Corynebacterium aquilae DSM 44791]